MIKSKQVDIIFGILYILYCPMLINIVMRRPDNTFILVFNVGKVTDVVGCCVFSDIVL